MPNNSDYITRTVSSSTYCTGTDRYCDVEVQVSYDNGSTWTTSSITPTFIDHKASECTKVMALNASGHVIGMIACNGSTSLTSAEINAAFDNFHCSIRSIVFCGCTVIDIGNGVLCNYRNLTSVTIPSSVATIGSNFLGGYTVRADGQYRKLKIEATTPPTLTSGSLGGLFDIIEVPCSGLYYYLNDVNWIKYYFRIKPDEDCALVMPSNVKLFCIYLAGTAEKLSSGTTLCDGSTVINKSSIKSVIGSGKLKEVLIGNCVTSISASTFDGSGFNLLAVYMPNSVTSIGNNAFAECRAITDIVIPSGVTSISDCTFHSCQSLSSATIPSGVTYIGNKAFLGCSSLTSITIPSGVTYIGNNAFNGCESASGSITIPNGITSIGDYTFYDCKNLTSISIPNSVTSIGIGAFDDCRRLTSINIPSNIASIGNQAFRYCSGLTSITVEATTPPALGNYAFDYTNNAPIYVPCQSVDAYKSASGWSNYASRIQCIFKFKATYNDSSTLSVECDATSAITSNEINRTNLLSVEIGDCVTSIGNQAFQYCSGLTSITVEATTPPALGNYAFDYTNNAPIYVPCESINAYATASGWSDYASRIHGIAPCLKWKASYSGGTTTSAECDATGEIVQYEIAGNKLIGLEIGTCVTRIGDKMLFNYINFDGSITIPDSVTSIGNSVFFNCKKLRTVTIGSGVTSMGNDVFFACDNLSTVTINAVVPPTLGTEAFDNTTCQIKVPSGSVNAYKSATNWSTYASRITSI